MKRIFTLGKTESLNPDEFFSSEFNGIYVSSDTYLNSPSFDYKEYQIPSRTGNVIQYNNRLNNVIRKLDCYIDSEHANVDSALLLLKRFLYRNSGYIMIRTNYDANGIYQYGYLAQDITIEPFNQGQVVNFSLYFSCIPCKFYDGYKNGSLTVGRQYTLKSVLDADVQWLKDNSSYDVYSPLGMFVLTDPQTIIGGASNTVKVTRNGKYLALYEYSRNTDEYRFIADGIGELNETFTAQYSASSIRVLTPIEHYRIDLADRVGYFQVTYKINSNIETATEFYMTVNYESSDNNAFGFEQFEDDITSFRYSLASSPTLTDTLSNVYYFINGMIVYFDINQFVNDYTDEWIRENLWTYTSSESLLRIDIDLINKTAEFVNDNIRFDMSKYITFINDIDKNESYIRISQVQTSSNLYLEATPDLWLRNKWWYL